MNPFRSRLVFPNVRLATALALLAAIGATLRGDVRLPALFTDHAVLQQQLPIKIWGWAEPGEEVRVEFQGRTALTRGSGNIPWMVVLPATKAGGPFSLTVSGNNRIQLEDVLVGEVWLASGQSNMEWPLKAADQAAADIASAHNPRIRLFTVPKLKAVAPVTDVNSAWQLLSPESVPSFSAVAYYFARALQTARDVPVGIIHTSWGGSPAEAWLSDNALNADAEYRTHIVGTYADALRNYQQAVAQWEKEKAEAEKMGQKFEPGRPWGPWRPAELYNGMIAPLIPFAVRGAIWYQGESNAGRAEQYRHLFPDMISNWRRDWGQDEFTFLAVQLAPWDRNRQRVVDIITLKPEESDWAELREAQVIATRKLPQVGVVVITDVGDKDDIHPTKKAPVGERLAQAARVIAYGEGIDGLSPTYRSVKFERGEAILRFDNIGRDLEARDGRLTGFAIAGTDRTFVWADATLRGNKVVVSSPLVPDPVAVRFGWADNPVVNLFSRDGLPVSPFRTDDWPMVTAGRK